MLGPDNTIWDDGEWVSWEAIDSHLAYLEHQAAFPSALDQSQIPYFRYLLDLSERYHLHTGRHLTVYPDIGELFASIMLGMRPNRLLSKAADRPVGNDRIEVRTIDPQNQLGTIELSTQGDFEELVVVRISPEFEVDGILLDRKALPWTEANENMLRLSWMDLPTLRSVPPVTPPQSLR